MQFLHTSTGHWSVREGPNATDKDKRETVKTEIKWNETESKKEENSRRSE